MSTKTVEHYMSLDYPIEIRKIPEDLIVRGRGYSACIPCLGRWAFYAEGESEAEALAKLREVKRSLFEHFISRGRTIPPPPPSPEWGEGE